jgi:hypothetical protein
MESTLHPAITAVGFFLWIFMESSPLYSNDRLSDLRS